MDDSTRITTLHNNPQPTIEHPHPEPPREPRYLAATALNGHVVTVSRCLDPKLLSVGYLTDYEPSAKRIVVPAAHLRAVIAMLEDAIANIEADVERATYSIREGTAY